MKAVHQHGTRAEQAVCQLAREVGLHYRLNVHSLPGSPDLANKRGQWAVFVNGCFWHGHKNCRKTKSTTAPRVPRANTLF